MNILYEYILSFLRAHQSLTKNLPLAVHEAHASRLNPFLPTVAFNICCQQMLELSCENATVGTNGLTAVQSSKRA